MQAADSESVILYYSDLRGHWPEGQAAALHKALPYGKRLEIAGHGTQSRATLAGIALALRVLGHITGRVIKPVELNFPDGGKPWLGGGLDFGNGPDFDNAPDFSISHSGHWVGCAAVARGLIGFDVEIGQSERLTSWAATEATLKACGAPITAVAAVELTGDRAACRGRILFRRAVEVLDGATACVMTSRPARAIDARAVSLSDLFKPYLSDRSTV